MDPALGDEVLEAAGGQQLTADVVQPDALACVVQFLYGVWHGDSPTPDPGQWHLGPLYQLTAAGLNLLSTASAFSATFSGVKPEAFSTVPPGADAPKRSMPSDGAVVSHPALPAKRGSRFDRDAGADGGRQHLVAVGLRLLFEDLPARQADHAGADAALRPASRAPSSPPHTSEPVAMRMTSGVPLSASAST